MFSFGKSAIEKATATRFAEDFVKMGLSQPQAMAEASGLASEVAKELKARNWDAKWEGQGDKYAEEAEYMTPRSAVGLTKDDVRTFWNRPLIVVFCDLKLPERIVKLTIIRAEAAGQGS